jgi:cob(I)alamin adenosyltransferase
MAFYTGKGDQGTTKLFDTPKGERISKANCNIESLGVIDELNSYLGIPKALSRQEGFSVGSRALDEVLHSLQEDLFVIQAELAGADKLIEPAALLRIEKEIADIEAMLPPVTSFLISGASVLSAHLDYARTLARRAERRLVAGREKDIHLCQDGTLAYLNRLSSILYALVRLVNHYSDATEAAPTY